ncbi:hypothetical protein L249_0447 [Ophiocordyceps polyrhachis-furcata BCC 54312]|uniref:Uncharacterized protein n=1 Tax=Ophiocordyceps polyrhachis-furcata BCC 54312 TaxID=1330021 RepID=A0A367LEZ6_9HYPO|nr:hypothetical protein L249_0447 [Ophiocordyceps polyrhachis-furcata BCC 54312]
MAKPAAVLPPFSVVIAVVIVAVQRGGDQRAVSDMHAAAPFTCRQPVAAPRRRHGPISAQQWRRVAGPRPRLGALRELEEGHCYWHIKQGTSTFRT